MVFVDFGNSFLRQFLAGGQYLRHHEAVLARAAATLRTMQRGLSRPSAVVLDIDEVLLSNIHMNSCLDAPEMPGGEFHACDYFKGPDGLPWPRDDLRLNPLLPGARALLETCRDAGFEIFLLTGRRESLRAETVENFVFVGIGEFWSELELSDAPSGRLIMRPERDPSRLAREFKEECRLRISATHTIVMTVGDQASDFGTDAGLAVLVPHPFYFTS